MESFMKEFKHLEIKLQDIKLATNNFDSAKVIGTGGFGKVYQGEVSHFRGKSIVAFKRLDRKFGQGDPEFWKEIMMLSRYTHQNLISLLGFCTEGGEKILVYEHASNGSLDRHLSSCSLTWTQRIKICLDVAKGLSFLHDDKGTQQRVLHRDIKSSNILLDDYWNAKVSDMGLSKLGPANQPHTTLFTTIVGTLGYLDPMYMEMGFLTKESDVYSFGVVLFEVLCGRLCFENTNGRFPSLVHSTSLETYSYIAYQCLQKSREQRPTLAHVVETLETALKLQEIYEEGKQPTLRGLESKEENCRHLEASLNRLEAEFRRLLTENSVLLPMSTRSLKDDACISPTLLPTHVIEKVQAILSSLIANNRLQNCKSIYVDIRSSTVRASLRALDLHYLEISVSKVNDVQSIERYIAKWIKHFEFTVKHLFKAEYRLCNVIFEKLGLGVWRSCFANLAANEGILTFIQFGKTITESKKNPSKLLKLLDIFASLDRIRVDFNLCFGGPESAEIQNLTRDLVKRVIEGASEIFWGLFLQLEMQSQAPPPPDASVPRLVSSITEYCKKIVGNDYKPILNQVLAIERGWKHEEFQAIRLDDEVIKLIRAIERNLDSWSKAYNDTMFSYVFLINNHWYLYQHFKGTNINTLWDNIWLKKHKNHAHHYCKLLSEECWGKLASDLSISKHKCTERLKSFNKAFEYIYKKHSTWIILDKELRGNTGHLIIQLIVPAYRSFMEKFGSVIEQDSSGSVYFNFNVQSLEKMLNSLFQPKSERHWNLEV